MIGIYKITNKINGKIYIGQSVDIFYRWKAHSKCLGKSEYPLYNDMEKYGIENFTFEILELCTKENLSDRERYYIEKFNSYIYYENSNGYNITLGGYGTEGYKHDEERKKKISLASKKRSLTKEHIERFVKMNKETKSKKVVCDGKLYNSVTECSSVFNLNKQTMSAWLSGQNKMRQEFVDMDLHYATEEEIKQFEEMEQVS